MFNKSMPILLAVLVASCGDGGGGSKPLTVTPPQSEVLTENPVISQFSFLMVNNCLLYTSPSPRDRTRSRMPSSA